MYLKGKMLPSNDEKGKKNDDPVKKGC